MATSGDPGPQVAYFSAEFGLREDLRIYSGGLGILAGDHVKAAADLDLSLVAVGLAYRQGYFRQALDDQGRQRVDYPDNDFSALPMSRVQDAHGRPLEVSVNDPEGWIRVQVWDVPVGSIHLYLLDSNIPENPEWARAITGRLYGGDRRMRIRQEWLLGVGGVRVLAALGLEPEVFHLNEGHSAFLSLERLRRMVQEHGLPLDAALRQLAATQLFTTHTPVPAGHDIFDADLALAQARPLLEAVGLDASSFLLLGARGEDRRFNMTAFAMALSQQVNGVSALHGEVSRQMWPDHAVRIGAVLNGVHIPSWMAPELQTLLARRLGPDWYAHVGDSAFPARVHALDPFELGEAQRFGREKLDRLIHERCGVRLEPDILTIGFARRFATYKRADLIFRYLGRVAALLRGARPFQLVLGGKAHPADETGQALIQKVFAAAGRPELAGRVHFVPDYDIAAARVLVQGVDLWLNNPRRPQEASGTSGMKAACNGVLNLSTPDGWWAECACDDLGWTIGDDRRHGSDEEQDAADARALLHRLEADVLPLYYRRDGQGRPLAWLMRRQAALARALPALDARRMVADYRDRYYDRARP